MPVSAVTGLTAARMLEIEAASIVGGYVDVNGDLILEAHDGSTSNAGHVKGVNGTDGAPGAPGATGVGPSGTILIYAGSSAPSGWLLCNGESVLRADYAALFAIIGTTYGSVDATHFTLPDLRGKVVVGVDASQTEFDDLGETGGEKTHVLTETEMPSHTHTGPSHTHTIAHEHSVVYGGGSGGTTRRLVTSTTNTSSGSFADQTAIDTANSGSGGTGATGSAGSGEAHNNLQPYIALNYIIKT